MGGMGFWGPGSRNGFVLDATHSEKKKKKKNEKKKKHNGWRPTIVLLTSLLGRGAMGRGRLYRRVYSSAGVGPRTWPSQKIKVLSRPKLSSVPRWWSAFVARGERIARAKIGGIPHVVEVLPDRES